MLAIAVTIMLVTAVIYISFKLTWIILKAIFSLIGDILEPLFSGTRWLWILLIIAFLM